MHRPTPAKRLILAISLAFITTLAQAQDRFSLTGIDYETTPGDNPVTHLQDALDENKVTLDHDPDFGYLKSLLQALDIPADSQTLVFSKTSFQNRRISPETPRAIYFNDDVYIGTVQNGDVIELSTADPILGAAFYTLDQRQTPNPRFIRQHHNCLQCHESSLTRGIPGHILRSVFPDDQGFPFLKAGTDTTNDASPFPKRWGGWYATGTHGQLRHRANVIATELERDAELDPEAGANQTTLPDSINTDRYLTPHSDIVALMLLGHQTHVHNLITNANIATRHALRDQAIMDKALDRDPTVLSDSTKRRIANAGDKLLDALLFKDEIPLTSPIQGTSSFTQHFQQRGPHDTQGRTLRQLDLQTRLFKYPLSYLIYSPQLTNLPQEMKTYLYTQLHQILTAPKSEKYPHLTPEVSKSIQSILLETHKDIADHWSTL